MTAEVWRSQYSNERYLEACSLQELATRLAEIQYNLLSFCPQGFPQSDCSPHCLWLKERAAHVQHELDLRQAHGFTENCASLNRIEQQYPNVQRAIQAWGNRRIPKSQYFVKYGQQAHLRKVFHEGLLYFQPASRYNDPLLNPAVRDTELEAAASLPTGTGLQRQNDQGNYEDIQIFGRMSVTNRSATDFYIFCSSAIYQHRLFDDFRADACLLVYRPKEFLLRMVDALKERYYNWLFAEKMVSYYDPLRLNCSIDIPFVKHFRYWYQREYRVVVKPKEPMTQLEPIWLNLGNVSDLCELIVL
ncbi:MAG TPA: hypothetical protein VFG71_14710 [Nitrospiraceae bacterium]|nr:hypothetical protein [Nitrospiraceae bacterium]